MIINLLPRRIDLHYWHAYMFPQIIIENIGEGHLDCYWSSIKNAIFASFFSFGRVECTIEGVFNG